MAWVFDWNQKRMTIPETTSPTFVPHVYSGDHLTQIAMPMGGIGAGCVCLSGYGGLQDFAIRNRPATTAMPDDHKDHEAAFALIHVKGEHPVTKLIEGPLPPSKLYDQGLQAQGYRHGGYEGLPRFEACRFEAGYPFGTVTLEDKDVPLAVTVTGWNPFIPGDDVNSSLPCALLEYRFENKSAAAVEFEFSYHLSHLASGGDRADTRNAPMGPDSSGESGGIHFSRVGSPVEENDGSAALYAAGWPPRIKAMWLRGGWFDGISALWREVSTGRFQENDGTQPVDEPHSRNGGSLLTQITLEPGETITLPLIVAWHFPNSNMTQDSNAASSNLAADCGPDCACGPENDCEAQAPGPAWRPFYAGIWKDAAEVALYAAGHYETLRARTLAFQRALLSSTVPPFVLDAVSANLAILKSPTVLRQENGNVWAWEGCFTESGCCHGSCTHVWNYAQALPHLFPKLERTLREQELVRSMNEQGHVNFRAALPDGPASHGYHAAADGQLGGLLKLYRDWQISGDTAWMKSLYPQARRSLDFCINAWDPEHRGGLFEPHHNTYDIEFWGPDGMCGSIYVGALAAAALMAQAAGQSEDAARYQALAAKASEFMAAALFNGEYYQQNVQWEGLRDTSFAERMAAVTPESSERLQLLKSEGPQYQYGSGCISDGVIGAWMARIYGVETPLSREQVRATLEAIYRHNFRSDLSQHACTQRPGYALGHEAGLLLCTWPRGEKPTLPFVYSDEVWTGIEYQVASHLIEEGFAEEGLALVQAVRSRYDGSVRNPFNEYECGSYYARAMASYALLGSLSGFRYSAVDRTLWFGPKLDLNPFEAFFSAAGGFGTIRLENNRLTVRMVEGEMPIDTVVFTQNSAAQTLPWGVIARAGQPVEKDTLTRA